MGRFRCAYCARWQDDSRREIEHIVPRAIGGSVTTERVCAECNRRVGREVDMPLLRSAYVAFSRHKHRVLDPRDRTRMPAAPRFLGTWEDGTRGFLEMHRDGLRASVLSEPIAKGDDTWAIPLPLDAPPNELRRILERLERREGGKAIIRRSEPMPEQTINATITEHLHTWRRFGSKIGLWLGTHMFGDEWLDNPTAIANRKILWDQKREVEQSSPIPSRVDSHLKYMFEPPQHTVYVQAGSSGAMAAVCLFGEWFYGAPLGVEAGDYMPAWVMDPHSRQYKKTDLDGLMTAAIIRA